MLTTWCELNGNSATSKNIARLVLESGFMDPNIMEILRAKKEPKVVIVQKTLLSLFKRFVCLLQAAAPVRKNVSANRESTTPVLDENVT